MFLVMATDFDSLGRDLSGLIDFQTVKNRDVEAFIAPVNGQDVVFSDAGETKAEVARNFSVLASCFSPSAIVGVGNAASLQSNKACIDDVMISTDAIQYDVDCSLLGYSIGEIPKFGKSVFYSDDSLVSKAVCTCQKNKYDYSLGRVISADRFNSDTSEANKLRAEFSADFLDMESAVITELAYMYGLPAVIVKGISNYGNDDAVRNYNTNRKKANSISLQAVFAMLQTINPQSQLRRGY